MKLRALSLCAVGVCAIALMLGACEHQVEDESHTEQFGKIITAKIINDLLSENKPVGTTYNTTFDGKLNMVKSGFELSPLATAPWLVVWAANYQGSDGWVTADHTSSWSDDKVALAYDKSVSGYTGLITDAAKKYVADGLYIAGESGHKADVSFAFVTELVTKTGIIGDGTPVEVVPAATFAAALPINKLVVTVEYTKTGTKEAWATFCKDSSWNTKKQLGTTSVFTISDSADISEYTTNGLFFACESGYTATVTVAYN